MFLFWGAARLHAVSTGTFPTVTWMRPAWVTAALNPHTAPTCTDWGRLFGGGKGRACRKDVWQTLPCQSLSVLILFCLQESC